MFNKNNKQQNRTIDFLEGSLADKIVMFAIPIGCSNILQQLFNSADAAVVGRFAGATSLAAVGANGPIVSLLVNLFAGLSVGVNVVLANYAGAKNNDRIKEVIKSVIPLAIFLGLALSIFGISIARVMHNITGTPSDVIEKAVLYLRIYYIGMPFILLYNYCTAVLRSKGDSKRALYALVCAGIINVLLNLLLVIVFKLGVAGVAIATVASNVFSGTLLLWFLIKEEEPYKVDLKKLEFKISNLKSVVTIGFPAGVSGAVFSISNMSIQSAINSFGAYVMAGVAAAITFENIAYYTCSAFASTAVTFISQNYAARKFDRCRAIFKYSVIFGIAFSLATGLLFNIFSSQLLNIMTKDALVKIEAVTRLEIVTIFVFLATFYEVAGAVLRGLGNSHIPAIIIVFGTCIFRVLWVSTVCVKFHTVEMAYIVYPLSWTLTSIITLIAYKRVTDKLYVRE